MHLEKRLVLHSWTPVFLLGFLGMSVQTYFYPSDPDGARVWWYQCAYFLGQMGLFHLFGKWSFRADPERYGRRAFIGLVVWFPTWIALLQYDYDTAATVVFCTVLSYSFFAVVFLAWVAISMAAGVAGVAFGKLVGADDVIVRYKKSIGMPVASPKQKTTQRCIDRYGNLIE